MEKPRILKAPPTHSKDVLYTAAVELCQDRASWRRIAIASLVLNFVLAHLAGVF